MKQEFEQIFLEFCKARNEIEHNLPSYTETGFLFHYNHGTDNFSIDVGTFEAKVCATFEYNNKKWACISPGGYTDRIDEMLKIIIDHFGE